MISNHGQSQFQKIYWKRKFKIEKINNLKKKNYSKIESMNYKFIQLYKFCTKVQLVSSLIVNLSIRQKFVISRSSDESWSLFAHKA